MEIEDPAAVQTEALPNPDLASVVAGPSARPSVGEALRAQYEQSVARRSMTVDLLIPGFDSLWGTFKAISDYGEMYDSVDPDAKKGLTPKQLNPALALDLVMASCVGVFAVIDGVRTGLGGSLGLDVYDQLFPVDPANPDAPRPQNDREATISLFPLGSKSLVTFSEQLQLWETGKLKAVDGELLGNS